MTPKQPRTNTKAGKIQGKGCRKKQPLHARQRPWLFLSNPYILNIPLQWSFRVNNICNITQKKSKIKVTEEQIRHITYKACHLAMAWFPLHYTCNIYFIVNSHQREIP
jgi:hypothetical protein